MAPVRKNLALSVLATSLACAAPPAPVVPAPEPVSSPPVVLVEPKVADPNEIRCGLDDGPVPIGERDDDDGPLRGVVGDLGRQELTPGDRTMLGLRMLPPGERLMPPVRPAMPWISARWSLGEGLASSPTFDRRARTCLAAPTPGDEGAHAFTVRFAEDGHSIAVASQGPLSKSSTLLACFHAALCETRRAASSTTATTAIATLTSKTMPPTFTGEATFTTLEELPGRRDRDGMVMPIRQARQGPFTPAERRWHEALGAMLQESTHACARSTPPAESFELEVRFPYDRRTRTFSSAYAGATARSPFERALLRCFGEAAVSKLLPPPPAFVKNGALTIVVSLRVDSTTGEITGAPR